MGRSRRMVTPLSDEIIMEILCRVPAVLVWKFRRVCRRWKALISSQYFAEMHLKANCFPMILAEDMEEELLLVDKWELPRRRTSTPKLRLNLISSEFWNSYNLKFSYNGLILFKGLGHSDIILNPVTGDMASVTFRVRGHGDIYGMFFHPEIKEFCIIWGSLKTGSYIQLKMFILGSQPYCRDLKPPSSGIQELRSFGTFSAPPVVIDEDATIYWMVRKRTVGYSCDEPIIAFDIKAERFTEMPHPGPTTNDCHQGHLNMNILKMDGRLSFVHIVTTTAPVTINIWTLRDSATRLWIKSHNVCIDECLRQSERLRKWLKQGDLRAKAFGNGELLLTSSDERYYACNLERGTIRKFGRKDQPSIICVHVPSLLSLKNCKFEISMEVRISMLPANSQIENVEDDKEES